MNINTLKAHIKKYLMLISLPISIICSIQGQGTFLDSEHRYSKVIDMLPISSDEYVIAYQSTYDEGTTIKWYKDNAIHKEHTLRENISGLSIEVSEEGIIIDASTYFECDIATPTFRRFLLDTIQNDFNYDIYFGNQVESFANIARLSNDNILLIKGYADVPPTSKGIMLKNGEDVIFDVGVPNENVTKIAEIDERVYIYGYEYVFYTDIDGGVIDTFYFEGNNVLNIVKTNVPDQIAILTWYGVYIKTIGSEVETLYPLALGDGGGKDIIFTDRLYLLRSYEEERNVVEVIDEEGAWEHYASLGLHHYELDKLYDMGPVGDELNQANRADQAIWITGQFIIPLPTGYNYYGSAIIQKLNDHSDEANDISLDVISIEGDGENKIDFNFTVKNNSNQTLKDIKIYSTAIDRGWCATQNLNFTIDKLGANKDTTIEASVGLYFAMFEGTVCVYILGSGDNPDFDMEDNITCLQTTKTNDLSPLIDQVIYPNPAGNRIVLKDSEENEPIEIINMNGQVVLRQKYSNGIQVSSLASGMYYLMRNKDQVFKFIKL